MIPSNYVSKNTVITPTQPVKPAPKALFNYKAYQKLIFLRDLKDCEVAVLGETKVDNPLHVIDIHLIKQKVSSVAADMDEEDISRHVEAMLDKGVHPINSERFWIHTHPMTGEGSANPSGKDMATWNDPNNSEKNFQVMFILSKSGHVTCKVRVRTDSKIAGFNKITYEESATFEVVESEEDKEYCKARLTEIFGEKAFEKLGPQILINHVKINELYPEFVDLEKTYKELVTNNFYTYGGGGGTTNYNDYDGEYNHYYQNRTGYSVSGGNTQKSLGFQGSGKTKKKPRIEDVPAMLFLFGENAIDFDKADYENTTRLREDYDATVYEIRNLYNDWKATREEPSWKNFLKGFVNVGSSLTKSSCTIMGASHHYKLKFIQWSQLLWPEVVAYCQAYNGGSDE